jgi:transposase
MGRSDRLGTGGAG